MPHLFAALYQARLFWLAASPLLVACCRMLSLWGIKKMACITTKSPTAPLSTSGWLWSWRSSSAQSGLKAGGRALGGKDWRDFSVAKNTPLISFNHLELRRLNLGRAFCREEKKSTSTKDDRVRKTHCQLILTKLWLADWRGLCWLITQDEIHPWVVDHLADTTA